MAVPAPRLLSFWQRSHDMNDLCAKPRIATWGFSKSGRKMRPDIVHNSKFLPRQGRGNPCCPRARGASGKDGLSPVPAAVMLQRGSQNDRFKTDTVQPKSLEWKTPTVWQARRFTYIRCFMVRSSQHHFRTSRSIAISGSFFILRASTLRSGAIMVFPRGCFIGAIIWLSKAASSPKGLLRFLPRCGSLNMRLNTLEQFRCGHVESSGYSLDCVQGNVSPAMLNLNDE